MLCQKTTNGDTRVSQTLGSVSPCILGASRLREDDYGGLRDGETGSGLEWEWGPRQDGRHQSSPVGSGGLRLSQGLLTRTNNLNLFLFSPRGRTPPPYTCSVSLG